MPWDLDPRKVLTPDDVTPADDSVLLYQSTKDPYMIGTAIQQSTKLCDLDLSATDWPLPGLVCPGLTELHGSMKNAGKSTFLLWLAYCFATGKPVFDSVPRLPAYADSVPRLPASVIYCSEAPPEAIDYTYAILGFDRDADIHFHFPYERKGSYDEWLDFIQFRIKYLNAVLVIFDTITAFSGVPENVDRQLAMETMRKLRRLSVPVIAGRHSRKGHTDKDGVPLDDDAIESSSGSGGWTAEPDWVMFLHRIRGQHDTNQRMLERSGRGPGGPMVIRLEDDGYSIVEDIQAAAVTDISARFPYLDGGPYSANDLQELLSCNRTYLYSALRKAQETGMVERTGTGKKGDPYQYTIIGKTSSLFAGASVPVSESLPPPIPTSSSESHSSSESSPTIPHPSNGKNENGQRPMTSPRLSADSAAGNPSSADSAAPVFGQLDKFGGIPELHGLTCIHADGTSLCPKCKSQYDAYNG